MDEHLGKPSEPIGSNDDAPFDYTSLLERCMGDRGFSERVLEQFRRQSARDIEQLFESLRGGDSRRLSRVAHGMKGAAANLSAAPLRGIAGRLEGLGNAAAADWTARAEDSLRSLKAEVERCVAYIPRALSDGSK